MTPEEQVLAKQWAETANPPDRLLSQDEALDRISELRMMVSHAEDLAGHYYDMWASERSSRERAEGALKEIVTRAHRASELTDDGDAGRRFDLIADCAESALPSPSPLPEEAT